MANDKSKARIGRYSGNERLEDPKLKIEPELDNDATAKLWFEEVQEDPDFLEDTKKDIEKWKQIMKMSTEKLVEYQIHTVGESHIDCAWLWRFEQTRQKAIKTFRKAVDHVKRFPGTFNFALSEPLLLEWVKEDDPALFKEIQETVKTGGIELVGGSYVEPDCMMPSGEAFVRQRLYGMKFNKDNFGRLPTVEWFLDSFGYNGGLPQILVKSGAKYFWTSKITWNKNTLFPFVNFWWESPDGSRLLTANFQMGTGPLNSWMMFEVGRHPLKPTGQKIWNYATGYENIDEHVEENEICPHIGNFFGSGDGGHGPTHQEVAIQNALVKLGFCKWSKVETFYQELEKWSDRFPVFQDELYLENHRGTLSVHAEVKRHNRMYENDLTKMESLAFLTTVANSKYQYPRALFEEKWKMVLRNQFHDVLPGSSIPEVYDDCWEDWVAMDKTIDKFNQEIGTALSSSKKTIKADATTVFFHNSLSWDRLDRVFIPISVFGKAPKLDAQGKPPYAKLSLWSDPKKEVICQPISAEPSDYIESMPAGWYAVISIKALSITGANLMLVSESEQTKLISATGSIKTSETTVQNGSLEIQVDSKTGALLSIKSAQVNKGNNVLSGSESGFTKGYADESKDWPAWNLTNEGELYGYKKYEVKLPQKKVKVSVLEQGPVFATLGISSTLKESPLIQKITLFTDVPVVFMEYLIDWKTPKVMLKVGYNTSTAANSVTADVAYGALIRSTIPITKADQARYEQMCHKYFDISTPKNTWGVAFINEGKYAYDAQGGDINITMLRSPEYPGPAGESFAHKERAINKEKYKHTVPQCSGLGQFKCRYALFPHAGGALRNENGSANAQVKQKAEEFNQSIVVIPGFGLIDAGENALVRGESMVTVKPAQVIVGACKLNEWENRDSLIVRVAEVSGAETQGEITLNPMIVKKYSKVRAVDLLEREIPMKYEWNAKQGKLVFPIKKFEICTFEFY